MRVLDYEDLALAITLYAARLTLFVRHIRRSTVSPLQQSDFSELKIFSGWLCTKSAQSGSFRFYVAECIEWGAPYAKGMSPIEFDLLFSTYVAWSPNQKITELNS
jgi:hypothetical protein